tara:strand:+ start:3438 stop:3602 length:165 start_codon:yes stop_codon:yes gene_type:complete
MNWINSWKQGNKKEKYNIEFRLGVFTLLEIKYYACSEGKPVKFRFILLNLGFEL